MANTLENCSSIAFFQHEWKLTINNKDQIKKPFLHTKKLFYQKNECFRVGIKNEPSCSDATVLFFLTTNLKMMGLKVMKISVQSKSGIRFESDLENIRKIEMKEMDLESREDNESGSIQLFQTPFQEFDHSCNSPHPLDYFIIFTVHLTGIIEKYQVHLKDTRLNQQMLDSITNQDELDFNLITKDGQNFPVHKWMLAARSPVFATLFDQEEIEPNHALECTVNEMNQFIKFIYFGELEGQVNHELMQLAVTYQIKTLENLCQIALQEVPIDKMAMIALHLKTSHFSQDLCYVENTSDAILENKQEISDVRDLVCTWKGNTLKNKKIIKRGSIIKMGVAFGEGDRMLFRAEFQMSTPSGGATEGKTIIVRFISFCHESISSVIEEVICCSYNQQDDSSLTEQTKMRPSLTHDGSLLRMFEARSYIFFPGPFTIKFRVKMRSTVENFTNKLVDSALSEQLWAAIVDRKMTDVEFLVGEESSVVILEGGGLLWNSWLGYYLRHISLLLKRFPSTVLFLYYSNNW